jgi:cytochrome c-type biogenesis protein CcmH
MKVRNVVCCFLFLFCLVASTVFAAQDNYTFADEQSRKQFLTLTETLRCPKCQNQNIADSDAMIAHDMRRKVYQLVQEGKSNQYVIDYMKSRYGDFVYYQPPLTPLTVLLWVVPVFFVVFGSVSFIVLQLRRKTPANSKQTSEHDEALEKANTLLKED